MPHMESKHEPPNCIALILCDQIYRDAATKKMVIIGTFNRILTTKLPAVHPIMTVLFTLTNARGKFNIYLEIEHESSGAHVLRGGGPMEISDPLAIADILLEFRNIKLDAEGKYWVKVVLEDGEILCQRPFWVELRKEDAHA